MPDNQEIEIQPLQYIMNKHEEDMCSFPLNRGPEKPCGRVDQCWQVLLEKVRVHIMIILRRYSVKSKCTVIESKNKAGIKNNKCLPYMLKKENSTVSILHDHFVGYVFLDKR